MPDTAAPDHPDDGRPDDRGRRATLAAAVLLLPAWPLGAAETPAADIAARLREGGTVLALRHALAPGTFDPPGFRLDDCRTQRNLSDEGRAQARAIGAWLATRGLRPTRVRSSPWCRCLETARLAFDRAEPWAALGSPSGTADAARVGQLQQLRQALRETRARAGFEVWVTHMFVLADLTGENTATGQGLVLRAAADGTPQLLARWSEVT